MVIRRKIILIITAGVANAGIVLGCYAIYQTSRSLNAIFDARVATSHKPSQYIYLPKMMPNDIEMRPWEKETWEEYNEINSLQYWFYKRARSLSWRLIEITRSGSNYEKFRAIKTLMSLKFLDDWDYQHLAQQSDERTAAMLAREPNINAKMFLAPPLRKECFDKVCLLNKFQKLLQTLHNNHKHWCLNYFISKLFKKFRLNYWCKDYEYLSLESVVPLKIDDSNAITLCVEALLHHISLQDENVQTMVGARGLEVLLDACRYTPCSFETKLLAVKILLKVSSMPKYLKDIHVTGWLRTLVEWSREYDQRLSSPAATALSNLEYLSDSCCFKDEVCLLHPLSREPYTPKVDVIIVHGLLGSAHSTWRQRDTEIPDDVPVCSIAVSQDDAPQNDSYCSLAYIMNEMPSLSEEISEEDFEYVLADIPVNDSPHRGNDSYSIPGSDPRVRRAVGPCCSIKSQCWPKDWLPKDFKRIRVLGVDYYSRITEWTDWCPFRDKYDARLFAKAKIIQEQLLACGVGQRPIVWIGHSMGGLLIKHILCQSMLDEKNVLAQTKSVFFLGTPHFGSPIASIRKYLAPLLPSAETKELEFNSPDLLALHESFSRFVNDFNVQVFTFIETKGAKLTVPPLEVNLDCVAPTPCDSGTGTVYEIPVGHVDLAKLSSPLSFIYVKIVEAIKFAAGTV